MGFSDYFVCTIHIHLDPKKLDKIKLDETKLYQNKLKKTNQIQPYQSKILTNPT